MISDHLLAGSHFSRHDYVAESNSDRGESHSVAGLLALCIVRRYRSCDPGCYQAGRKLVHKRNGFYNAAVATMT